jgi:hypothetical protein
LQSAEAVAGAAVVDDKKNLLEEATNVKKILGYFKDERGLETMEWIGVGALVIGMAVLLYPGVIQDTLTNVVGDISSCLTAGGNCPWSTP